MSFVSAARHILFHQVQKHTNIITFVQSFWCSLISVFQQRNWVSNVSDVEVLYNENLISQVLTNHYERCGRYYGSGGWGSHGSATEEERRLTMMLFSGIFDSLAQRVCLIFLSLELLA